MNKSQKTGLPVKTGLVGCGGITQVIHLPTLKKHPDVKLQALCDLDTPKANVLAEKFNIPNIYEDITDMLNQEELDVLFILTPNNLHLPMAMLGLEYGLHIFIEKPAGRNGEEVRRIKTQAEKTGKIVMVGMQNRFRADMQALHKFIQAKELGRLFFIKAGWLQAYHRSIKQPWLLNKPISGGGVVLDLGVQMIDLIWWLLGKPVVKSVKSFACQINPNLSLEDFCSVCVNFADNLALSLEISWNFPIASDRFYLEIAGQEGIATLDPLRLQKIMHGQVINLSPEIRDSKISSFKLAYQNEVNHFLDYLSGRTGQLESGIEDALEISRIVDAIYESIKNQREIQL
jgi:predicted dehydrogenase